MRNDHTSVHKRSLWITSFLLRETTSVPTLPPSLTCLADRNDMKIHEAREEKSKARPKSPETGGLHVIPLSSYTKCPIFRPDGMYLQIASPSESYCTCLVTEPASTMNLHSTPSSSDITNSSPPSRRNTREYLEASIVPTVFESWLIRKIWTMWV